MKAAIQQDMTPPPLEVDPTVVALREHEARLAAIAERDAPKLAATLAAMAAARKGRAR